MPAEVRPTDVQPADGRSGVSSEGSEGSGVYDVVVVGGGPCGVATALFAARRGLRVVVLEEASDVYELPRAIGMDDEIQLLIHDAGLGEGLRSITTPMEGGEFVDVGGVRLVGVDVPVGPAYRNGLHPVVSYDQPELERLLRAGAVAAGVELRLGVRVTGVGQDDEGVWAGFGADAGPRGRIEGRWLVAADGASSPVRKALGVPLTDLGFDQDWLVTDLRLTGPDPGLPRLTQQWCDPARPTTYVPGHGAHRRWELQVQPGERREDLVLPECLWPLLARWITPDQAVIARAVVYRFHAVVAERMRIGRVFLAGDAAHQMPPFLGQGLCSGLRDAANLAWKLDLVTRGLAADALLDTYDEERRPHATGVVAHAVDSGRLIDQLAGRTSAGIGLDAGYGGGRGMPALESGFVVPGHRLVGRPIPADVVGGPAALLAIGSRLALVATPGVDRSRLSPRWAAMGAVAVDAPAGRLPEGTLLVMRPDRCVAGVATGTEAIAALEAGLLVRC